MPTDTTVSHASGRKMRLSLRGFIGVFAVLMAINASTAAAEMPDITIAHLETPSPLNPLGAKGVGEGGAIPAPAALAAAVEDALRPFYAEITQIPTTPFRVKSLIAAAQKQHNSHQPQEESYRVGNPPRLIDT